MSDEPQVSMYHPDLDTYHDFARDAVPTFVNAGWVEKNRPPAPVVVEPDSAESPPRTRGAKAPSSEPDGSEIEEH